MTHLKTESVVSRFPVFRFHVLTSNLKITRSLTDEVFSISSLTLAQPQASTRRISFFHPLFWHGPFKLFRKRPSIVITLTVIGFYLTFERSIKSACAWVMVVVWVYTRSVCYACQAKPLSRSRNVV